MKLATGETRGQPFLSPAGVLEGRREVPTVQNKTRYTQGLQIHEKPARSFVGGSGGLQPPE
jgi:hypothetical protein